MDFPSVGTNGVLRPPQRDRLSAINVSSKTSEGSSGTKYAIRAGRGQIFAFKGFEVVHISVTQYIVFGEVWGRS